MASAKTTKKAAQVVVTQVKSGISQKPEARKTLRALGLTKIGSKATHVDNPVIRGMIRSVDHLVSVEEVK